MRPFTPGDRRDWSPRVENAARAVGLSVVAGLVALFWFGLVMAAWAIWLAVAG